MPTRRSRTSSDAELTASIRNASAQQHNGPAGNGRQEPGARPSGTPGTGQHDGGQQGGQEWQHGDRQAESDAALDELFRRHRSSVLAYARTCCRDPYTAEDLTSEAFTRTLRAVRSGGGPTEAWRPYLLTTVRRAAAAWSDSARRTELAPDFERWLDDAPTAESGEERMLRVEDGQLVLRAFQSLPERWQSVLWHSTVEEEPAPLVAGRLGISSSGVASLAARAREGLREAYLSVHAERANSSRTSDECRRYTGLLAASVRRTGRRGNKDLDRHLGDCPECRRALLDLTELNSSLRSVLPAAVLLWGGSAYLAKGTAATAATTATTAAVSGTTGTGTAAGATAGVSAKLVGAVGATIVALAVGGYLLYPDGDDNSAAPSPGPSPTRPAAAEGDGPPSESPTATPNQSRKSSKPSTSTASPTTEPPPTSWSPKADARTRLRVMSTDRCMDIAANEGAEPHETSCDGGRSQRWDLLVDRAAQEARIRNQQTGMCLTHTASGDDGAPVRQRPCDSEETAEYMRWTYFQKPDNIAFAQKDSGGLFLGLNEWNQAADGKPHSPTIGTTPNYYNTESLRFRYDGELMS